ncbi:co-chaperone HscB [Shewanella sp. 1_MG-2023]|uniref:co-chaperone HscB n=1 Tax=unclassified Shewanella TaxID=196818 RepID=UPI0026E2E20A|nr:MULTISPECIES: co-chaperone HscB [unclassified Shewanella]MDO6611745.1 co-chaperone HscB [Shewanella sp. 7_MG-2023]MDO6771600.1 co-chaperone HscB [Shewanella sp. 2_MG-2023]MDO6793751.1 co-chaperone HscB [Shewanella sp. 1_MG-2023]
MNYFELFQITPSFDIDTANLAERYRELQRAVHPDKFANESEQQKLLSVQRTAQVNDGYQTLKNPLRRAEHMLSLRGIDISHETTTVKDTAFLMQQMEWRESLEDIKDSQQADELIDDLYQSFAGFEKTLSQLLATFLATESDENNLSAADQIRKLKFMAKLQDELARVEDSLLD